MVVTLAFTLITYLLTILFFRSILDVAFIFNGPTFLNIMIITAIAWAPIFLFKKIYFFIYPPMEKKVQAQEEV
jgi:hypothetical protein